MTEVVLVGYGKEPIPIKTVEFHVEDAGNLFIRFFGKDGKVIYDTGFILETT